MKPTVRPARESDYEAIENLLKQDANRHAEALPKDFMPAPDTILSRGHLISTIEDDGAEIYAVAELDDVIVGFTNLVMEVHAGDEFFKPRSRVTIDDLIVAPEHPEANQALLEAAEAWAKHHNAEYLTRIAYDFDTDAAVFFQENGFAPHTVRYNKPLK